MDYNNTVTAILCARMSSSRFLGKVLADLGGITLLEQCITRLYRAKSVKNIVVAIPDSPEDDPIATAAERMEVAVFRGSLLNVVERMWDAMHSHGMGTPLVYRAMSDQPFMDWEALDRSAALMLENNWDLILPLSFEEDPVYGAGVSPWSYRAFQAIRENSTQPDELEHPGMWLRRNLDVFDYGLIDLPHWCYRPYRLELDTPYDRGLVLRLIEHGVTADTPLRDVIRILDRNPRLTEANNFVKEATGTFTSYTREEIERWYKDYAGRPVVWSDMLGLVGSINPLHQKQYKCPKCGGALVAITIVSGDLQLKCVQCGHKKKYYAAKPRRRG